MLAIALPNALFRSADLAKGATPAAVRQGISVFDQMAPWMLMIIIIGVLLALIISLWMVYSYINRIRTDEIRRYMLYDSVFDSRYRKLLDQAGLLDQRLKSTGPGEDPDVLDEKREQRLSQLKSAQQIVDELKDKPQLSDSESDELCKAREDIEYIQDELQTSLAEKRITRLREDKKRDKEEREKKISELLNEAKDQTEKLIPPSMTIAGMGITGSFFVELTAILTIIFGIIILGLTKVLTTTEIAPILAAIAGYVLGKTTSGWAPYGGAAWLQQATPPPAQGPQSPASQMSGTAPPGERKP